MKRLKTSTTDLANFHDGEWSGQCQSTECRYIWRLTRNHHVSSGIRSFLLDMQKAFPSTPIQVVLPEHEAVARAVIEFRKTLAGRSVAYTSGRYNYIQNIGEGMTLLDLSGTNTAPVLLGVGAFVSPAVLDKYLNAALKDLNGNRGSSFRGSRSVMYEGQYTLKDENGRNAREESMCKLLARSEEIGNVVLYEAADWAYRLPWNGFDFLDKCSDRVY